MNDRDELRPRHMVDAADRIANYLHGYFDVDLGVVWQSPVNSVPPFANQIRAILSATA